MYGQSGQVVGKAEINTCLKGKWQDDVQINQIHPASPSEIDEMSSQMQRLSHSSTDPRRPHKQDVKELTGASQQS